MITGIDKLIRIILLLVLLPSLQFIWQTTKVQASQPASVRVDEGPGEVTLDNGFRIVFEDVIDNDDGTSVWMYFVEEMPGSQDLGNWVLALPDCAPVVTAFPEPWETVHPDPNAQLDGIKWEVGGGFEAGSFSVTVEGHWAVGTTQVAAKGPDVAQGEIAGPICEDPDDGGEGQPVATPDYFTTTKDTRLEVGPETGVLANDAAGDGGEAGNLTAHLVSGPAHGTLDLAADGSFVYTPDPGFTGQETFAYKTSDGAAESPPATVTITVTESSDQPVANDDTFTLEGVEILSVSAPGLLDNDSTGGVDGSGNTLQVVLMDSAEHGTITLNQDGAFTYRPENGFFGEDSFTYVIRTGDSESGPATVTIQVKDSFAPTVTWLSPTPAGEITTIETEPVVLEVLAEDNWSISSVTFFRWDAVDEVYVTMAILNTAPYRLEVKPAELNPEWNQVFAITLDAAGHESDRQYIWLYREVGPALQKQAFLPLASK